jgi:hypothetical protein
MNETRNKGYVVEQVEAGPETGQRERAQEAIDAGAAKGWKLVGVANGAQRGHLLMFWDTTAPSFGRTDPQYGESRAG